MEVAEIIGFILVTLMFIGAVVFIIVSPSVGERHGQCYGNKTCNSGLVCLQSDDRNECVRVNEVKYGPADGGAK